MAFRGTGIATPEDFDAIPPEEIHQLCQLSPRPNVARAFWGAQRANVTYGATAVLLAQPPGVVSRDSFLKAVKRRAQQFERPGRLRVRARKKLHVPAVFSRMGPSQKIKLLAPGVALPGAVRRFVEDIAQANLLKQVRGSLPWIASAFRRYLSFCDLPKSTPLPASTGGGNGAAVEHRV